MAIKLDSSYRRLDLSKSRVQLEMNAQKFASGGTPDVSDLLEIRDYSCRTPVRYEVVTDDYLEIARCVDDLAMSLKIDVTAEGPQEKKKQLNFDKKLTEIVLDLFPMTPHEAANRDVWSYISLRVLPHYAAWRFPNKSDNPEWERFIGQERNTFKRLWWRAHMLGPELAVKLQEDDLVQMMERTESIGSNKFLMRSLVKFTLEHEDVLRSLGGKSSAIFTETGKALRRSMAIVGYEAMDEYEMERYVRMHAEETIERIVSSKGQ